MAEEVSSRRSEQYRGLFDDVGRHIRAHPGDFLEAGLWLDRHYDDSAVRQHEAQEIAAWRRDFPEEPPPKPREPNKLNRFILATEFLLDNPQVFRHMNDAELLAQARLIALLSWLAYDRYAHQFQPRLTELQDWPWGASVGQLTGAVKEASGSSPDHRLHRSIACEVLIDGDRGGEWCDMLRQAWEVLQSAENRNAEHRDGGRMAGCTGGGDTRGPRSVTKRHDGTKPGRIRAYLAYHWALSVAPEKASDNPRAKLSDELWQHIHENAVECPFYGPGEAPPGRKDTFNSYRRQAEYAIQQGCVTAEDVRRALPHADEDDREEAVREVLGGTPTLERHLDPVDLQQHQSHLNRD